MPPADSPVLEYADDADRRRAAMVRELIGSGILPAIAEHAVGRALAAPSAFAAWTALIGAGVEPIAAVRLLRAHDAFPFLGESAARFLARTGRRNPADRQRPPAFQPRRRPHAR